MKNQDAYELLRLKLKAAREDAGLTQQEVATILERPQSLISKIETGERRVDFIELQVLARIYDRPVRDFEDEAIPRLPVVQGRPIS